MSSITKLLFISSDPESQKGAFIPSNSQQKPLQKSKPKSKQYNPVGFYDKKMSVKDKGWWLNGWQNAQKRDAKDKNLYKSYKKHGNKNVFSKIARDLIAVPGDWNLNDKDIAYIIKPYLDRNKKK